jgi:hypothetical protein
MQTVSKEDLTANIGSHLLDPEGEIVKTSGTRAVCCRTKPWQMTARGANSDLAPRESAAMGFLL